MADVGGDTLQLERLEACPAEERCVGGDELAKVLHKPLVHHPGTGLLFRRRDLRGSMLADSLVSWPVCLLAIWGLNKKSIRASDTHNDEPLTQYWVVICIRGGRSGTIRSRRNRATYAATAKSKPGQIRLLNGAALVAYTVAPLFRGCMSRGGEVVRGSGLGVDSGHVDLDED